MKTQKEKRKKWNWKKKKKKHIQQNNSSFFFSNLMKHIDFHIQEIERNPRMINAEKITLRPIMIKLLETQNKEKFLTAGIEKKDSSLTRPKI